MVERKTSEKRAKCERTKCEKPASFSRRDDFGKVEGAARRVLGDLLAAAEAVGDEDGFGRSGADGGQENALADGLRDSEFFAFEAEGACHAAAAGVQKRDGCAGAAEDRDFVGHLHHGFVMAVAVEDDSLARKVGRLEVGRVAGEEFAQEEGLVAQALGAGVAGEEVDKLVAEDGGATRFKEDEGESGVDLRGEVAEDFFEIASCCGEESEVVERATAANVFARDFEVEACALQDLGRGVEGLRVVVVVPRVGPQEDASLRG